MLRRLSQGFLVRLGALLDESLNYSLMATGYGSEQRTLTRPGSFLYQQSHYSRAPLCHCAEERV